MLQVVWFKRDLRVHDHAPLAQAVASGGPVLPLYILEPQLWRQPVMAGRHHAFMLECLASLDAALARRGANLVIRVGEALDVLAALHRVHGIEALHSHEETGIFWTYERDLAVRRWARRAAVPWIEHRQHGVWRASRSREGWALRWDRMMQAAPTAAPRDIRAAGLRSDEMPDPAGVGLAADPCPGRQRGGRPAAIALLGGFLQHRGRDYRRGMSSPATAAQSCSRLSPHLAFGSVSLREVLQAAVRARRTHVAAGDAAHAASLRSFVSRLHWHCHFIQKLEDEPLMERRELHAAYAGLRPITDAHETIVAAWAAGRTGFPFVDACMRSLAATGWLNFRMRSMVMSFVTYQLWQDWRLPAAHLARLFTDFEPGIHYPQAQMQSGVTGVNTARIYNPVKQSMDQDPAGQFIRRWVPELETLPTAFLHEPWRAPAGLLRERGINLGDQYPTPLVDHLAAAARARQQVYAVRSGADYRAAAAAIQEKHGSRRSGLAAVRPRKQRKRPAQAAFDI